MRNDGKDAGHRRRYRVEVLVTNHHRHLTYQNVAQHATSKSRCHAKEDCRHATCPPGQSLFRADHGEERHGHRIEQDQRPAHALDFRVNKHDDHACCDGDQHHRAVAHTNRRNVTEQNVTHEPATQSRRPGEHDDGETVVLFAHTDQASHKAGDQDGEVFDAHENSITF